MGIFQKKPPVEISAEPDAIDLLPVLTLEENSDLVEAVVRELQAEARTDAQARALLEAIYYQKDRALAFSRYAASRDFAATRHLLDLFGVTTASRMIEVGAGPGFLASALNQLKYPVEILEPSTHWNSGTGYLRTRKEDENLVIHTDHVAWHRAAGKYDVVLTKNCIHHFQNITQVAICLRQRLVEGGRWIAIREWYADNARELAGSIKGHPFRARNPVIYEWPYPAHHYAEALELAGLRLEAVVPDGYANGCLGSYSEEEPSAKVKAATAKIDQLLASRPEQTVKSFWAEVKKNRFEGGKERHYSRPQAMIFRKVRV